MRRPQRSHTREIMLIPQHSTPFCAEIYIYIYITSNHTSPTVHACPNQPLSRGCYCTTVPAQLPLPQQTRSPQRREWPGRLCEESPYRGARLFH